MARHPVLQKVGWVEIIAEDADVVAALQTRYRNAAISVTPCLLPTGDPTPKDTRIKAHALDYMVEQHRAKPAGSYVVHYHGESIFTPDNFTH